MTTPTSRTQPRITVVGGGIGGLATAAFLARHGLTAHVLEQAAELREVGAGVVAAPNIVRLLRRLGRYEDFSRSAVPLRAAWQFQRWEDGRVLSTERLDPACEQLYGERTYTAHRADLLATVRGAVPAEQVSLGVRAVGVTEVGDHYRIDLADGSSHEADVVVAADGVHSVLRQQLAAPEEPEPSGIVAYRALVPAEHAPPGAREPVHTLWLGPDHHLVHYPVSAGRLVNVVAFGPAGDDRDDSWTAETTVEQFRAEFAGWDRRVTDLVAASGRVGRWALLDRPPLPRWTFGGVTLLGDAAHPQFPFYAQGAAQAVEDAATLAVTLSTTPDDPHAALLRYEELRRARTAEIQRISHGRVHANHLPDGAAQRERDARLADGDPLVANGWIYGHDAEAVALAAEGRT
ncbi:FAD-dependent monooxygenase [Georgenia sp. Z1491]|uniref:FAD-dependent monooxygenase n=1 Tax=Georgenia sp. Z1491 TaxID=3416707 RepID=UPI003CFA6026